MQIITNSQDLRQFCQNILANDFDHFITIDTEFQREKTYWPQVCLIQIAGSKDLGLIDPLSEGLDLQPLKDLLVHPTMMKVFHAGRQDIEIFYHLFDVFPTPFFDTQIAAPFCGYGDSISYKNLVKDLLKKDISKHWQYSDWMQRPLRPDQIDYAAQDVTLLRHIYEKLKARLIKNRRFAWVEEDCQWICQEKNLSFFPRHSWKSLSLPPGVTPYLKEVIALARTREIHAQKKNVPRGRILESEALLSLGKLMSKAAPGRLQSYPKQVSKTFLNNAYDAYDAISDLEVSDIQKARRNSHIPNELMSFLSLFFQVKANQLNVPKSLIATMSDLKDFFMPSTRNQSRILQGWRQKEFGDCALDLLKGTQTLKINKDRLDIITCTKNHI